MTPRDVVMLSTADWKDRYWTNKQHTASRLGARGYRVLYVESVGIRRPGLNALDLGRMAARLRSGLAPIREVADNVWVLSPLTIPLGHRYALVGEFNRWQLQSRMLRWLRRRGSARPLLWTYHPYMMPLVAALDPAALVYHSVDDLGAIPGVDHDAYGRAEAQLLARADHVFVTSRALYDRCVPISGARTHYFGNVADIEHFAQARGPGPIPPDLAAIPSPRMIYVGALSDFKIDFGLIGRVAATRPDWHLVFIGDEREGQHSEEIAALKQRPNVHFLGWRAYAELPAYLRGCEVALLPQLINDYTRSMFPMKFFEYLAAGLSVVATPLPALADCANLHRIASGADAFAAEIQAALDAGRRPLPLDHSALRANTWDARLDAMLAVIGTQAAGDTAVGSGTSG